MDEEHILRIFEGVHIISSESTGSAEHILRSSLNHDIHQKDHHECHHGNHSAKGQHASAGDISEDLKQASEYRCGSFIPDSVIDGRKRKSLVSGKYICLSDNKTVVQISCKCGSGGNNGDLKKTQLVSPKL